MKATTGLLGPPQVLPLALSLILWTLPITLGPLQQTAGMQEQLLQQLHGLALVGHCFLVCIVALRNHRACMLDSAPLCTEQLSCTLALHQGL